MSTRMDRVLRAYAPLRLRGTLVEGHGMQARQPVPPAPGASPKRLHLFALLAPLLRHGRGRR